MFLITNWKGRSQWWFCFSLFGWLASELHFSPRVIKSPWERNENSVLFLFHTIWNGSHHLFLDMWESLPYSHCCSETIWMNVHGKERCLLQKPNLQTAIFYEWSCSPGIKEALYVYVCNTANLKTKQPKNFHLYCTGDRFWIGLLSSFREQAPVQSCKR